MFGSRLRAGLACAVALVLALEARPTVQTPATAYTVFLADGRRMTLPFRTSGGADMVSLDQLAAMFSLTLAEDALVGGLTLGGRGQTILLIPNQSFASIGPGRIVSLPAAVQKGNTWQVPVDFIRLALAPALGLRAEVRRASRVVLVGDVRLPAITGRFERAGADARLVFDIQPAAPYRVTREGSRLVIRFDAAAVDLTPVPGLSPDFVGAVREDGTALMVDLGPSVTGYRTDSPTPTRLTVELTAPGGPAPPPAPRAIATPEPPALDTGAPGTVRTIVLDAGHGGADAGATGPAGTKEKDYVLQLSQRLKTAIETRIGLRVLLTRDADELVPVDRRTSLANNNKADLFISLHANASVRPDTVGTQVLSLNATDYAGRPEASRPRELPVPVVTGGSRVVDLVPWDLAQMPFADRSSAIASMLTRRLRERGVPLFTRPTARLPLRPLVGANMPAIMVEVGFLSNPTDEAALTGPGRSTSLVEAIVDTINDVRRGVPSTAPGAAR